MPSTRAWHRQRSVKGYTTHGEVVHAHLARGPSDVAPRHDVPWTQLPQGFWQRVVQGQLESWFCPGHRQKHQRGAAGILGSQGRVVID